MILPTMLALPKNFSPRWYSTILLILLTVGCFCQKSPLKPHVINKKPNVQPTEKQPATLTLIPPPARLIDSKDFTLKLQHDGGKGAVSINNYHLAITINNTTDALENLTNPTDSRIAYNDARNTPQNSTSISCKLDQLTSTITLAPNASLTIPFTLVPGASTKKITINIQLKHLKDNTVQTATIAWIAPVQERMSDMIASLALTPEEVLVLQDLTHTNISQVMAKEKLQEVLTKINNNEEPNDREFSIAIHKATEIGSLPALEILLALNPNIKDYIQDRNNHIISPLSKATNTTIANFLMDHGFDPGYAQTDDDITAAHRTLYNGNLEAVKAMEERNPRKLFDNRELIYHGLLLHSPEGDKVDEAIEWLLPRYPQFLTRRALGSDANVLHFLSEQHNTSLGAIEKIINETVRQDPQLLNQGRYDGKTPLQLASYNNNPELVAKYISTRGIDKNKRDNDGNSPLITAAENGSFEALKLLIWNGGDVTIQNNEGDTALHKAVRKGNPEPLVFLLNNGANPNKKNNKSNTPLHEAVLSGKIDTAGALLQFSGTNRTIKNGQNKTAQQLAIEANNQDIIDLF